METFRGIPIRLVWPSKRLKNRRSKIQNGNWHNAKRSDIRLQIIWGKNHDDRTALNETPHKQKISWFIRFSRTLTPGHTWAFEWLRIRKKIRISIAQNKRTAIQKCKPNKCEGPTEVTAKVKGAILRIIVSSYCGPPFRIKHFMYHDYI